MNDTKNIHDGHRERLRNKAEEYGMQCLEEHELLELLLGYSMKRCNTNNIAHDLINHSGSLREVFNLSTNDMKKTKGVGYQTAFMLRLIGFIMNRPIAPPKKGVDLAGFGKVKNYAKMLYGDVRTEVFYALYIDKKFKLLDKLKATSDSMGHVTLDRFQLAKRALDCNASAVIFLHNHPNGINSPSRDDVELTNNLISMFDMLQITVVEHIIFSDGEFYPIIKNNSSRLLYNLDDDFDDFLSDCEEI